MSIVLCVCVCDLLPLATHTLLEGKDSWVGGCTRACTHAHFFMPLLFFLHTHICGFLENKMCLVISRGTNTKRAT